MTDKQSTKPARGTRDFLPDDIRRREYVINIVRDVYQRYGFEPLETPAFENIETLLGKYGEEGNKLIFKILKRGEHEAAGEADLALRYDLTVPLARVVAQYQNEIPKFFKRYQIQPVWRADRPGRGRFREFCQCDIDAIGSTSPVIEAEILGAVSEILTTLRFNDFVIRLNHRGALMCLLDSFRMPPDALIGLDKLDKIGVEGVVHDLVSRGVPGAEASKFVQFFCGEAGAVGVASQLWPVPENNDIWLQRLKDLGGDTGGAVTQLKEILALTDSTPAAGRVRVDPSLARGLSYYTGAIMEIAVEGIGSLGGGGRYDTLVGMFLGRDVPACGFSLGLERIIVVMTERNMFKDVLRVSGVDVLVTMWSDATRSDALALASELRNAGLRVDIYPEADKLGKQLKYASDRDVQFAAIVGDDERASGQVQVKDLLASSQQTVMRGNVPKFILSRLNPEPGTQNRERTLNPES